MNTANTPFIHTFFRIGIAVAVIGALALLSSPGCIKRIWERDEDIQARLANAPDFMVDEKLSKHLLVMQAPSPGWSVRLDRTERTEQGKRVYITIRKPDPAYLYTQQIVLMRTLTSVSTDSNIEIAGRLLDFDESTKNKGYAAITPVESFDE